MMRRLLASRKFTTAILGALLVGLNDALELGLDDATIKNIVTILAGWLIGESVIDAASVWRRNGNGATGGHP